MNVCVKNKNYILTGGSSGIGLTLLRKIVSEGANVLFSYNCADENKIHQIFESLNIKKNQIVKSKKLDISNEISVYDFFKYAYLITRDWDVLINNAGITKDSSIDKMSFDEWGAVWNVNLNGTFLCTKNFASNNFCGRNIKDAEKKIINIGSIQGQNGSANQLNYASSKSALIGFTKSAASELAEKNISVNLICPGFVLTNLNYQQHSKLEKAKKGSLMSIENNLETLTNFILYLTSDLSNNVTGQIFNIDSRLVRE